MIYPSPSCEFQLAMLTLSGLLGGSLKELGKARSQLAEAHRMREWE